MKREQIEKLAIDNIVRIYNLVGLDEPAGFPDMSLQEWRDLIQLRLGNPDGSIDLQRIIRHAKDVRSVRNLYTVKFLDFLLTFLDIRIKKLSSSEFHMKPVANSQLCAIISDEEIKRISRYLNKHPGAKTFIPYGLFEAYQDKYWPNGQEVLTRDISKALEQKVLTEMAPLAPRDYRVQTKYLEENIWVFIPALPQIIIKLKY